MIRADVSFPPNLIKILNIDGSGIRVDIIITLFSTKIAVTTIPESQLYAGFTVCVQAVVSHGG